MMLTVPSFRRRRRVLLRQRVELALRLGGLPLQHALLRCVVFALLSVLVVNMANIMSLLHVGDGTLMCGAAFTMSLYTTSGSPGTNTDLAYIGCYNDDGVPRIMQSITITGMLSLTPQLCANVCYNAGYGYSGIEAGNQCYVSVDFLCLRIGSKA